MHMSLGGGDLGIAKAICLGDIGFFLAFRLISDSNFPERQKNRALSIFSRTMLETGVGELLDVELGTRLHPDFAKASSGKQGFGEAKQDVITVYKYKTAYYTIVAPLLLGAVLAGSGEADLTTLKEFGQNLGIAFQIQDDINDIFSEKNKLGKEAGGDIKEGKKTLLYLYAREQATSDQIRILNKYYGNPKIGINEIEVVKKVLIESGAVEYAKSEASKYAKEANLAISGITDKKEFRNMLEEMSEYFIR